MASLSDMRLSNRIYVQQIILLIALIGSVLYTLLKVNGITHEMEIIRDDDLPVMREITHVTEQQLEQIYHFERILRLGAIIDEDSEARKEFNEEVRIFNDIEAQIQSEIVDVDKHIEEILRNKLNLDETTKTFLVDIKEHMRKAQKLNEHYAINAQQVISEIQAGRMSEVTDLMKQIEETQLDLAKDLENFLLEVEDQVIEQLTLSTQHAENLTVVLLVLAVIVGVVGLGLTVFTGFTLNVLKKSVDKIGGSVLQVATAADQSSSAISTVADGAKQQTEAIGQAVTAVDQSVGVITEVSTSAEESTTIAKESANMVNNGMEQMQEMISVVNRISDNSNQISKITEIISNIASQTNMLSLNAAIEAARAGEHGKGFAVVAEQVRKLAENSKSSVQDIVELIGQATRDAEEAVSVAGRVNEEMSKISQSAHETEKMMQNIATSMEQQVATIEELQHNMDTLKDIGNNNASASEEITETILELSRIANDTNIEVGKFNL